MTPSDQPPAGRAGGGRRARVRARGPGRLRLAVCAATVAACVPYLTIKIAWLSGSTVGWNDAAAAHGSALYVGNAVTMGMDAAAVVVALAFTFAWGRRVPAWLVLVPIWIAAGLLGPIVLAVPLGTLVQALSSPEPIIGADDGLQGWVYAVVYTGFTAQGIGLLAAFVLYARDRWPRVHAMRTADLPVGATHSVQVLMARAAVPPAACYAFAHLFWACGGTAGRPRGEGGANTALRVTEGVWALLALAGAVALLAVLRREARPLRLVRPLAVAWIGSGSTFAWPLYQLVLVLGGSGSLDVPTSPASGLVALAGMLAGLVMGLTGAVLLTEQAAAGPAAGSASQSGGRGAGQRARPIASSTP